MSANIIDDLIFMFMAKRPLHSDILNRLDETAEMDVSDQRGRRKQQSFAQAAPNELKLGEGGHSGKSWPSAWRWRRGTRRRRGRKISDQRGIRAVELQPDLHTIQVCLVEHMKYIYYFTKCLNINYMYDKTDIRVVYSRP